jgi:hypothetical protein
MAVIIESLIIVKVTVIIMLTNLVTSSILPETVDITMEINITTIIQRGMGGDLD